MICKRCGGRFEGPKRNHECDLLKLTDGRTVRAERVDSPDGDLHQALQDGEIKIEVRFKQTVERLFER